MISIEVALLILSLLLLISIYASKISDRVGVPALLLFLVIGMLAGSDGIGGLAFTDARLAQNIGVVALAIILFSGGLDTEWNSIRPVMKEAIPLALVGVAFTAVVMGVAAY
ncbi:MAG TPA: potassium/proton antiporter, partial [Chloroflexi bacterium]|nr:potassium/proton antiporter [Chloroflexota bacterium]